MRHCLALALCCSPHFAAAVEPAPAVVPFAASGTVQYALSPDDRADDMIITAIDRARRQVLVQAYSVTHKRIAAALAGARRRGVEVAVLADREQSRNESSALKDMKHAGVPLLIDAQHAAAHNKIMIIDNGEADCAVVTGSFNFTYAAQHRNAENAFILRGNPPLCEAFHRNWLRHKAHSLPPLR